MEKDIDKLIDNSTWSIKMYIGLATFFLLIQCIIYFTLHTDPNWNLTFFSIPVIIVLLTTKLVLMETKMRKKLIAIKKRIK